MRARWVLGGFLWWAGCAEPAGSTECGARAVAAPLFGAEGPPRELEQLEQNAVVALTRSSEIAPEVLCTGVLLASDVVLTARHCAELLPERVDRVEDVSAYVGSSVEHSDFVARVLRFETYDDADLALAFLAQAVPRALAIPLEPWAAGDGEPLAVGHEAILAGFGLRKDNGFGLREFLSEPIVELSAQDVTVDGDGQTGACVGDSGGPLLLRDDDGQHRVVGVLSLGSASCLNLDVYIRLEPARAWLDELLAGSRGGC